MHHTRHALLMLALIGIAGVVSADIGSARRAYENADYDRARRELGALLGQSNGEAEYYLGLMYEFGHGVIRDLKRAERLYEIAAKHEPETRGGCSQVYFDGQHIGCSWFECLEEAHRAIVPYL